ncbi:MAG TPA: response regulator [Chloroflexota bacterium]|jgi:CheY-like chemotaxis protein|nr:response regulator [Chloroflexota bacterium]
MQQPRSDAPLILVTEDNPLHMKIFVLNLTFKGYRVLEAENGLKGLELARRELPDLILVDLTLPKMEGWEMIRQIKASPEAGDIPVIVVSARRPQDEEHEARALRIDHYVSKPFNPEHLMDLVDRTVRRKPQSAE